MMDHTSDECLMSCSRQSRAPHLNICPLYRPTICRLFRTSLPRSKPSARNLWVVGGHSWEEHYRSHLSLLSNDDTHDQDDDDHYDDEDGSLFPHKIVKSSPSRRLTHNLFAWNSIFIQQKLLKYSLGGPPKPKQVFNLNRCQMWFGLYPCLSLSMCEKELLVWI